MRAWWGIALVLTCGVAPVAAQAQSAQAAKPAPAAQTAKPAPAPATKPATQPPDNYTYEPEGRRDPFVSLVGQAPEVGEIKRGEGAAGLTVGEITVRGVLQSRDQLVAMIQGPDKKTYLVHQGDKLADGTIKSITPQGLVIVQDVNDPLSLVKQREVRKLLRSLEDVKE